MTTSTSATQYPLTHKRAHAIHRPYAPVMRGPLALSVLRTFLHDPATQDHLLQEIRHAEWLALERNPQPELTDDEKQKAIAAQKTLVYATPKSEVFPLFASMLADRWEARYHQIVSLEFGEGVQRRTPEMYRGKLNREQIARIVALLVFPDWFAAEAIDVRSVLVLMHMTEQMKENPHLIDATADSVAHACSAFCEKSIEELTESIRQVGVHDTE